MELDRVYTHVESQKLNRDKSAVNKDVVKLNEMIFELQEKFDSLINGDFDFAMVNKKISKLQDRCNELTKAVNENMEEIDDVIEKNKETFQVVFEKIRYIKVKIAEAQNGKQVEVETEEKKKKRTYRTLTP